MQNIDLPKPEDRCIECVYVAGKYSDDSIFKIIGDNVRLGIRTATRLLLMGYSPYCPFLDYQFLLLLHEGETITLEMYHRLGMNWLRRSEAILMLPNWESSVGATKERKEALMLDIPVFNSINELNKYVRENSIKL